MRASGQRAIAAEGHPAPGDQGRPSTRRKLSVAIIAQDEEARIGRTIDAIQCADEIVVIDGGSRDRTVEICQARGCRVAVRPFDDFANQKRFAAGLAAHDWVLALDADEVLTPELNQEIRALMAREEIPEAAFRIQMTLVFLGRPFRRGHQARDRHVRLFDRRRAGYNDKRIHEGVSAQGEIGLLHSPLFHHSARDLSHTVAKINDYSTRGALALHAAGARRSQVTSVLSWPFYFFKSYVLRRNFLNGSPGLVWSFLDATNSVLKYLKLAELRRAK